MEMGYFYGFIFYYAGLGYYFPVLSNCQPHLIKIPYLRNYFPIEKKYRDVKIIKQLIINKLYKWYTNGYI